MKGLKLMVCALCAIFLVSSCDMTNKAKGGMIGGMASLIGYPAAFLGAAVSMTLTKWDTTNHKITKVVLCIFCILCAMQFVLLMTGNAAA